MKSENVHLWLRFDSCITHGGIETKAHSVCKTHFLRARLKRTNRQCSQQLPSCPFSCASECVRGTSAWPRASLPRVFQTRPNHRGRQRAERGGGTGEGGAGGKGKKPPPPPPPPPVSSMRGSSFQTLRQSGLFNRPSGRGRERETETERCREMMVMTAAGRGCSRPAGSGVRGV